MQILVKHKLLRLNYSYDIVVDEELRFQVVKKYFSLFTTFLFRDIQTREVLFTIKNQSSILKTAYSFYCGNEEIQFRQITLLYGHHQCQVGGNVYDIYANYEFRFSIFKNGTQVAWIGRKDIWGDAYEITADSDCDASLFAIFCILIDYTVFRPVRGKFLLETSDTCEKDFDMTWLPK